MTPYPCIVLVHYGPPDLTLRCLRNLAAMEPSPHRAIVVDNGPGEGLEAALAGAHPALTVLPNPGNPGFGAGCNVGAARAFADGATAVWFLNNDATLEGPVLEPLAALARRWPQVALWGTWQRDGDRRLGADLQAPWCAAGAAPAVPGLPPDCRLLGPRETLSGASIRVARAAWDRLGPWPGDYFLYLEDTAWCLRAHRLGLPLALADLEVVHPRSSTIGRHSRLSIYYGVRNQLRLHRELHPSRSAARLGMAAHLLQKRFFQGRWGLLAHTWRAIRAAARGETGRAEGY